MELIKASVSKKENWVKGKYIQGKPKVYNDTKEIPL
jgi:predicted small secreted protein